MMRAFGGVPQQPVEEFVVEDLEIGEQEGLRGTPQLPGLSHRAPRRASQAGTKTLRAPLKQSTQFRSLQTRITELD